MMVGTLSEKAKQYAPQLLADVLEHAETDGDETFLDAAFTDLILDDLEQEGRWPDFQLATYRGRKAAVDVWGIDEQRRILFMAVADFDRNRDTSTISAAETTRWIERVVGFVERAVSGRLEIPDHNPVSDLVDVLRTADGFDSLQITVLTDRVAASTTPVATEAAGYPCAATVWDLEAIRRSRQSGERLEPINVELPEGGLPFLGDLGAGAVRTLLLFVPASLLAEVYQLHGGRLLERNVRAFLSARGKVNRGLKDTLRDEPERFLAYNNGLTATAAGVTGSVGSAGPVLHSIRDLQIVNGGQTTASIAAAAREGVDLSGVAVQVKLVVIEGSLIDEMVPNISRYANRQNAVQESDLSANHPFLRNLEMASRTEWTPPGAAGRPTKWYFERARGSFGVESTKAGTVARQKVLGSEYPKSQHFNKNDLAVYENTWSCLPHLVCRGGQKNFVEFMERLSEVPPDMTESASHDWFRGRFRELVAKAILFRTADKAIDNELGGTYKRAVTTYSIAWLLTETGHAMDLQEIWATQSLTEDVVTAVVAVAAQLKPALIESADGRNITEWAKRDECWATLRDYRFTHGYRREAPRGAPTTEGAPAPSRTGRPSESGVTLAEAIESVFGEPIEGGYRRYRRRRWQYLGDTVVPGSDGSTLHLFSAPMPGESGGFYIFNVVVDFPRRQIMSLETLTAGKRREIEEWLRSNGHPLA